MVYAVMSIGMEFLKLTSNFLIVFWSAEDSKSSHLALALEKNSREVSANVEKNSKEK